MKIAIDYKELINEINDEVAEGVISLNDQIQILRATTATFENYFPIIDWYYDDYVMNEELNTPVEEMYLPEEFTEEEWEEIKAEHLALKKQYELDKPNLLQIKAKDALTEMKQMQKLFK